MNKHKAKNKHFLNVLRQRLNLHLDNASTFTACPSERDFRVWIWQALKNEYRHADISLILLDEEDARTYNRDYRGKDYATNVLSFAFNEGEMFNPATADGIVGDLIICPQVVASEASEQGKDLTAHFAHLTIHGTLHLMGYDHMNDAEAKEMENLEIKLLQQLNYPNPYAEDEY
ncbi:MAG: rRNA maturation RNase YbeY [Neisseria sp.]|nr:rRNA maturation RNase YbeY [Neisseria sp.]